MYASLKAKCTTNGLEECQFLRFFAHFQPTHTDLCLCTRVHCCLHLFFFYIRRRRWICFDRVRTHITFLLTDWYVTSVPLLLVPLLPPILPILLLFVPPTNVFNAIDLLLPFNGYFSIIIFFLSISHTISTHISPAFIWALIVQLPLQLLILSLRFISCFSLGQTTNKLQILNFKYENVTRKKPHTQTTFSLISYDNKAF